MVVFADHHGTKFVRAFDKEEEALSNIEHIDATLNPTLYVERGRRRMFTCDECGHQQPYVILEKKLPCHLCDGAMYPA
jgi:hypothetical protein